MSITGREIQMEYDEEDRNCYVIWESGKAIGLGTTHLDAMEDLREAARFYIDTIIDLKMRDLKQVVPAEGRGNNGNI